MSQWARRTGFIHLNAAGGLAAAGVFKLDKGLAAGWEEATVLRVWRWRTAADERVQATMAFISSLAPKMLIIRFIL